jgi:hypothetical protein
MYVRRRRIIEIFNKTKFLNASLFFLEKARKEREQEINDSNTKSPSTEGPKERGTPLSRPMVWDRRKDISCSDLHRREL